MSYPLGIGRAREIAELGDSRDLTGLVSMLEERDVDRWVRLRTAIVDQLATFREGRATCVLRTICERDRSDVVRAAAAQALAARRDKQSLPLLHSIADSPETSKKLRTNLIESLGLLGSSESTDHILPWLTASYWPLRFRSIQALRRIKDRAAVEPLIGCLNDEKGTVRAQAAMALAEIGDARALEPLKRAAARGWGPSAAAIRAALADLQRPGDP